MSRREDETVKARLVLKRYNQKEDINYEESFSPLAVLKPSYQDSLETFKARLIIKGYNQKKDIDYEETFSLLAMLMSIRILLANVVYLDFEYCKWTSKQHFQMAVLKNTSIYMEQLEWFKIKDQEHKFCKLKTFFL